MVLPKDWAARREDVRWPSLHSDMVQYRPDLLALDVKDDQSRLPTVHRAQQRENIVDSGDHHRPHVVR